MGVVTFLLLVFGLELSTQGVSLVFARLRAGLSAVLAGVEFHVGAGRFVVGVIFLVLGLILAALGVWSAQAQAKVAVVGDVCPQCGNDTRRVKRKDWQRLLSFIWGERLTRRRCETCHWTGLSLRH